MMRTTLRVLLLKIARSVLGAALTSDGRQAGSTLRLPGVQRASVTMATAHDVAAYILKQRGPMTAMKLQKLVYYAQAWHLVRADKALFDDVIQAWAAGPVVKSLYVSHRGKYTLSPGDIAGNADALDPSERRSVDVVLGYYGNRTAEQLSELTHSEQPWINARNGLGPMERGERVIDPTEMMDYYTAFAREQRERAQSERR
ncbi:Panacea domain-containing protein [Sorangium sp. So ce1153]|uniref:Panacea domain-containing protein n=1 Tax=Sorangium sp. So ce1153 TaxID=3133333 RepID=UPI003F629D10